MIFIKSFFLNSRISISTTFKNAISHIAKKITYNTAWKKCKNLDFWPYFRPTSFESWRVHIFFAIWLIAFLNVVDILILEVKKPFNKYHPIFLKIPWNIFFGTPFIRYQLFDYITSYISLNFNPRSKIFLLGFCNIIQVTVFINRKTWIIAFILKEKGIHFDISFVQG